MSSMTNTTVDTSEASHNKRSPEATSDQQIKCQPHDKNTSRGDENNKSENIATDQEQKESNKTDVAGTNQMVALQEKTRDNEIISQAKKVTSKTVVLLPLNGSKKMVVRPQNVRYTCEKTSHPQNAASVKTVTKPLNACLTQMNAKDVGSTKLDANSQNDRSVKVVGDNIGTNKVVDGAKITTPNKNAFHSEMNGVNIMISELTKVETNQLVVDLEKTGANKMVSRPEKRHQACQPKQSEPIAPAEAETSPPGGQGESRDIIKTPTKFAIAGVLKDEEDDDILGRPRVITWKSAVEIQAFEPYDHGYIDEVTAPKQKPRFSNLFGLLKQKEITPPTTTEVVDYQQEKQIVSQSENTKNKSILKKTVANNRIADEEKRNVIMRGWRRSKVVPVIKVHTRKKSQIQLADEALERCIAVENARRTSAVKCNHVKQQPETKNWLQKLGASLSCFGNTT